MSTTLPKPDAAPFQPPRLKPLRGLAGWVLLVLLAHLTLLQGAWQHGPWQADKLALRGLSIRLLPRPPEAPAVDAADADTGWASATPVAPPAPPAPSAMPASASTPIPHSASAPLASQRDGRRPAAQPPQDGPPTALLAGAAWHAPAARQLLYQVRGESGHLPYTAQSELRWQPENTRYQASLDIRLFLLGRRSQTSSGQLDTQGLAPERFSDKARGSEVAVHFERDKGRISFSANTPDAVLQPGAQDRLSLIMQLAAWCAADAQHRAANAAIEFQVAGPRAAETWRFNVQGPETLHLPGGTLETVKLTRWPQSEHEHKLELWLASALDWLPARLRVTQDNGDFVDQQWESSVVP